MAFKLYKTISGAIIESEGAYYAPEAGDWNSLINDDSLFDKLRGIVSSSTKVANGEFLIVNGVLPPIDRQEIWASGVTYFKSREARMEESKEAGGGNFYEKVYDAPRPELFFKATSQRTVGSGQRVRIRRDSTWNVPEPELTLFITSSRKIVGFTIGNDMSSRSIEGENPLYLPQAKVYEKCAALGPCILVKENGLRGDTFISMKILRDGRTVFMDTIAIDQIKRSFEELAEYLFRECEFPYGCFLMTGTGMVPPKTFTLAPDDEVRISIEPIGTLVNTVDQ